MYKCFFSCECGNKFEKEGDILTKIIDDVCEEGCYKCKDNKNKLTLISHEKNKKEKSEILEFVRKVGF